MVMCMIVKQGYDNCHNNHCKNDDADTHVTAGNRNHQHSRTCHKELLAQEH